MPFSVNVVDPLGGLDLDTDLAKVKNGDYTGGLNIQHISQGGQTTWAIENTLGNKLRFTIPSTSQQNKEYKIQIQISGGALAREITIYDAQGAVICVVAWNDDAASLATSYANFLAALNTAIAATIPLQTITVAFTGAYATIILTTVAGFEYSVVNTGVNPTQVDILLEAWDNSLTGEPNIIGSYDLLGDLFIWSTPQVSLPSVLGVTLTASNNAGNIKITTSSVHGLISGQSISISGASGAGAASTNGTWIVSVINSTSFNLQNSVFVSVTIGSASIITINAGGIGEIGVAVYDPNTDTTTYTTLIKSKEFNFRVPKQIDTYCEANNFERSIYWTDDYNIPRVFYYSGPYIFNGAMRVINSLGTYFYGTISAQTKLILTNELLQFTFTKQYTSGGAILSGNWRYAIRLLTKNFSATNWTELSNLINVYKADQNGFGPSICGDLANVVTPKINEFSVTGIPSGIFFYIELAAVNYVDNAIVGYIASRTEISGSSITLRHTGNEPDVTNLDVSTLNVQSFDIETAKNIDAIDNRLILSNLTTAQEIDFTNFSKTFTHSIKRDTITNIGLASVGPNKFGEYQDPMNVYNKLGYRINEMYRLAAKYQLKSNGGFTKLFYIDDIVVNTSATNITTPNRRIAGLADDNLTSTGADPDVYVPYIEISGINPDYLIDGIPVRNLITSIHFERVDITDTTREVLATGVAALSVSGRAAGTQEGYGGGGANEYGEYPEISGYNGVTNVYPDTFNAHRNIVKLYSPDILCGVATIDFLTGDTINAYGNGTLINNLAVPSLGILQSSLSEYNGFFTSGSTVKTVLETVNISDGGGPVSLSGGTITYYGLLNTAAPANWIVRGGPVIRISGTFNTSGANTDVGIYNIQYFRAKPYTNVADPSTSKYGNPFNNTYIPTGAVLQINSSTSTSASMNIFGGEAFTQKTYLKHRSGETISALGSGGGISFYSQNIVNSQMIRKYANSSSAWDYPNFDTSQWLYAQDIGTSIAPYDKGYGAINGISSDVAFDPNLPSQNDLPTQIRYSDLKPQNSIVDNYRVFLPLNFKDLPLTFGEIIHHANFNGELFTWQPRMLQRQYFNTRGTMNVGGQTPTQVLIGDGSVFSRDGQMVTVIGTNNKWSVVKGKSAQGNDVIYWINTELKKVMRLGFDGTISIADIHGMQSFFANNLKWVRDKDNPASGEGICGVWDDRYRSAIWTVRGKRIVDQWEATPPRAGFGYEANIVAAYAPVAFSTFEETGEFYVSKINFNTALPTDTTSWQLIPHSGSVVVNGVTYNSNDYYNEYTIEYNEQKNKFTTFYTFKPKIYLKWTDTFLTPKPISNTGETYEHRLGDYCVWYGTQTEDGYLELLFNKDENLIKEFFAILINSEILPARIDYFTKKQQTFVVAADFEQDIDFWMASIKNDILTSSNGQLNDEDTSRSFGQWIKIRITFSANVYQKVVDLVIKYLANSRTYNK